MKSKILVVGDVMLDKYWFGSVKRISPEAPVPIIKVESDDIRLGGAANVAYNIKKLGFNPTLLSIIGKDQVGNEISEILKKTGIKKYLVKDSLINSTLKLRIIALQQQLLRVDFEKSPLSDSLRKHFKKFNEILSSHDLVIFSDYAKGNLKNIKKMINLAKKNKKIVFVDPKSKDFSIYIGADLITPNVNEFTEVMGEFRTERELTSKAFKLCDNYNIKSVLITRSEKGMTLFSDRKRYHVSTVAKEVFDVSGAGDTVIAVLGGILANGGSLMRAVDLANKAAGIVVSKVGTSYVSKEELFS